PYLRWRVELAPTLVEVSLAVPHEVVERRDRLSFRTQHADVDGVPPQERGRHGGVERAVARRREGAVAALAFPAFAVERHERLHRSRELAFVRCDLEARCLA